MRARYKPASPYKRQQIPLGAQAGGELIHFAEEVYNGADRVKVFVRKNGMGGASVWPALLCKLDRVGPWLQVFVLKRLGKMSHFISF